uniref:Uncharacterized protein n=1 Tax=Panagrolaimus superbus TaxID=310955 RepID=A0A914Z148_9BILA
MENGSFLKTSVATIIIGGCGVNFIIGLSATIGTRYLLIFPSKVMQYLNLKIVTVIASGITVMSYIAIICIAISALSADVRDIRLQAKDYDVFFQGFREKSLIFIPFENFPTMYFVAPYRRYISKQFKKLFPKKLQQPEIQMITPAPTDIRRVQVHVIVNIIAD